MVMGRRARIYVHSESIKNIGMEFLIICYRLQYRLSTAYTFQTFPFTIFGSFVVWCSNKRIAKTEHKKKK